MNWKFPYDYMYNPVRLFKSLKNRKKLIYKGTQTEEYDRCGSFIAILHHMIWPDLNL